MNEQTKDRTIKAWREAGYPPGQFLQFFLEAVAEEEAQEALDQAQEELEARYRMYRPFD